MDWERPPRRGPGSPNVRDVEELLRRWKDNFNFSSFQKSPVWLIVGVVILALLGLNSYYTVQPEETGVVQRLGRFSTISGPGPHFKIPFGIDTVRKVVTGRVLQREYGYRTVTPAVRSRFVEKGYEVESVMLSGDLNVLNVQWTIQYKVNDPVQFLFQVDDVEGTLDDISESVMRRIVGNRYSDDVLTVGRASIAEAARKEIQEIMDRYKTGLQIIAVQLQNANPPDPVKAAFNEVNESLQEKERMINEAQQAYNQKIPKAQGEARQTINQAEGYALDKVNRSHGDVQRFLDILTEYEKAPAVTEKRMYIEAFGDFVNRIENLLVVDETGRNILPFLDLNKLQGRREAGGKE